MNPELSKTAITQLSNLLRSSLQMGKHKTVMLKEELKTVTDYLAIEKIRFDDRLTIIFDIDADANECQIPPMMLQTLAENAVKHGISTLKQGGEILITAQIVEGTLQLDIINSGHYQPKEEHEGVGVVNTQERLKLLYEDKASFLIKNIDANKVLTQITIPL